MQERDPEVAVHPAERQSWRWFAQSPTLVGVAEAPLRQCSFQLGRTLLHLLSMTMRWRFADGTEVRLGGQVDGETPLARELREQLELLPIGRARPVPVGPQPGGDEELVLSSPRHIDGWCRIWSHLLGVELIEAPELPPPHPEAAVEPNPNGRQRIY